MSTSEPPPPGRPGQPEPEPESSATPGRQPPPQSPAESPAESPAQSPAAATTPVRQPPPEATAGSGKRRWRPSGRWPWVVGGAAALVLALLVGAVGGFAAGHRGGPGWHTGMPAAGWNGEGPGWQRHGHGHGWADDPGDRGRPDGGPGGPGAFGEGPDGFGHGRFGGRGMAAGLVGTVTSVDGANLVLTQDGGGPVTVTTSDRTRVVGDAKRAVSDLKPGDRVVVRTGPDHAALAVLARPATVRGTVTALNGTQATVTAPNGLTRTVDTSGLPTQPKVGDLVAVQGSLADNGATLKAQTLRVMPRPS